MSENHIVLVESPADLSVLLGRIRISRKDHKDIYIAPEDLAVICLHHHSIQLTSHVLRVLVDARAVLIVTDEKHHPCGMLVPAMAQPSVPARLYQQLDLMQTDIPGKLWQSLVRNRIRTQAANLRHFGLKGALRLERMVDQVEPGDSGHMEGQAARHYWRHFFGEDFKRQKQGAVDLFNVALNYGYAVLRALVAREIAICGLTPALGLGHRSKENPFNLADDFLEPYRFTVERHVRELAFELEEFNTAARRKILRFIEGEVALKKNRYRIPPAIRESVASFCRILDRREGLLTLPG